MKVHLGVKPATYPDGEKLSDVMRYNNYGTETIPPRPVFRIAAEQTIPNNTDRIKAYLHNIVANPNKADADRAQVVLLQSLGAQASSDARKLIKSGGGLQPNAPATIKKKGFDKPLYETGLMSKNIAYEIGE